MKNKRDSSDLRYLEHSLYYRKALHFCQRNTHTKRIKEVFMYPRGREADHAIVHGTGGENRENHHLLVFSPEAYKAMMPKSRARMKPGAEGRPQLSRVGRGQPPVDVVLMSSLLPSCICVIRLWE